MGLNIGAFSNNSIIDAQALNRVTQQILNPNKENSVDVSSLDLSKFNRVSLGTDLYGSRTNAELAIQTAKAATDFDVNLSKSFTANVQYLNSMAAQSLFTSKENTGKVVVNVENTEKPLLNDAVSATQNVQESANLNKDRRGSNPFSFYINTKSNTKDDENNSGLEDVKSYTGLNIFA